jgi:hypothetical protein
VRGRRKYNRVRSTELLGSGQRAFRSYYSLVHKRAAACACDDGIGRNVCGEKGPKSGSIIPRQNWVHENNQKLGMVAVKVPPVRHTAMRGPRGGVKATTTVCCGFRFDMRGNMPLFRKPYFKPSFPGRPSNTTIPRYVQTYTKNATDPAFPRRASYDHCGFDMFSSMPDIRCLYCLYC